MHDVSILLVNPVQRYVEVTIATMIDDSLINNMDIITYTSCEVVNEKHAASTMS